MDVDLERDVRQAVRDVTDFPKPGILFRDMTPVLEDPHLFGRTIDHFTERYRGRSVDAFLGIESRGFLLAAPVAAVLRKALVLVRKPGKLPRETIREEYALEYGTDALELHVDAVRPGMTVVVMDDLLATGGTMSAACALVNRVGAHVLECSFLIELSALGGRERLSGRACHALIAYGASS